MNGRPSQKSKRKQDQKIIDTFLNELNGWEIIAWNGFNQKKVIVTLQNKAGKQIVKTFEFASKNMQGVFTHKLRRLYYGSN